MKIEIEVIENIEQIFWIIEPKISSQSTMRIYPKFESNVMSGRSVAVYLNESGKAKRQIAQLSIPDYNILKEKLENNESIDLSYSYIDNFSWLGNLKLYEMNEQNMKVLNKFTVACSFWNNEFSTNDNWMNIAFLTIKQGNFDFEYSILNNIKLNIASIKILKGNINFENAQLLNSEVSFSDIQCDTNQFSSPEISFNYSKSNYSTLDFVLLG